MAAVKTSRKFVTSEVCIPSIAKIANKSKISKPIRARRRHRCVSKLPKFYLEQINSAPFKRSTGKISSTYQHALFNQFINSSVQHLGAEKLRGLENSNSCANQSIVKNSDLKSINNEKVFTMQDNEMNDTVRNVCFERSESQSHEGKLGSRFNSPVEGGSSRSSKSPNSIEDLNKEMERLFLNNEKFGLATFLWDKEEIAEGRRAPIADMLHCYKNKGYNRRKKRRSATVLGIRNYNDSDSSNGISSPDDTSGCEDYSKTKLIETLDPRIIVPVPVGKSEIDLTSTPNFGGPFSSNKLQLSEDSAFAPIKAMARCQSTPPEDIEIDNDENKLL